MGEHGTLQGRDGCHAEKNLNSKVVDIADLLSTSTMTILTPPPNTCVLNLSDYNKDEMDLQRLLIL
jgi:hypothetical protein